MDTVSLPAFRAENNPTIEDALDAARQGRRAAVTLESEDAYRLFYLRHLYEAKAKGVLALKDISDGYPIYLLSSTDGEQFALDLVRPTRTRDGYQQLFAEVKSRYALVGLATDFAMIVTQSESLARILRLTGGYQCNGHPKHYFPDPEVSIGQDCPKFPACGFLADGSVPKISAIP